jgi:methylglutaconyl-CoA hydratase
MTRYQHLRTRTHEGVLTITLNRPEKRNALHPELIAEIGQALDAAAGCECGVVVVTGAGAAFCAGLDLDHLETLTARTAEEHLRDSRNIAALLRRLYDFPKPTIAAVNGPAIAGGMGIATCCDFTIAASEAKFGYTEARIGFVPAIVASFLLRQVGEKQARDLLLSGRILKAEEACGMGLVTRVVDDDRLMESALELAHSLLANSPESMLATKRLLSLHASETLDRELAAAIAANAEQRATEDFREGVRAFLERRRPEWPSRGAKAAGQG